MFLSVLTFRPDMVVFVILSHRPQVKLVLTLDLLPSMQPWALSYGARRSPAGASGRTGGSTWLWRSVRWRNLPKRPWGSPVAALARHARSATAWEEHCPHAKARKVSASWTRPTWCLAWMNGTSRSWTRSWLSCSSPSPTVRRDMPCSTTSLGSHASVILTVVPRFASSCAQGMYLCPVWSASRARCFLTEPSLESGSEWSCWWELLSFCGDADLVDIYFVFPLCSLCTRTLL